MPYVCKKCDSESVQTQEWRNPNTGEGDESGEVNTETTWCKDCQDSDLGIEWKDDPKVVKRYPSMKTEDE